MNVTSRARLAPIVLAPLALVAALASQQGATTTTLDVTATRHTESTLPAASSIFDRVEHPADVAAREAGWAVDRMVNARWRVDGDAARVAYEARMAAEAEAEAEAARLAALRRPNHEGTSPRLGGSTGGGSAPSGCSAPGPTPPDYIRTRESGGDYGLNDPNGHYGAWQFSPETWAGVGGSGNPADASPAEQDCRAAVLWNNGAGASNWAATL